MPANPITLTLERDLIDRFVADDPRTHAQVERELGFKLEAVLDSPQPSREAADEEPTAREHVEDALRLAGLESAPEFLWSGRGREEAAWLRGRDDTVEYIRDSLSPLPDSLTHRASREQELEEALREIRMLTVNEGDTRQAAIRASEIARDALSPDSKEVEGE